jgi:demethylmenaquinone methyltransferase / 2-methoxy-6-polyprenyl-1,4-benzoquinol methylase
MTDWVSFGYAKIGSRDKKRLVRDHFDLIANTYDLADAVISVGLDSLWRRKSIHLLDIRPGDRVLDVCGGTARLAIPALQRSQPDGVVIVYDFNKAMLEEGRRRASKKNIEGSLLFVQGDAEELSFPGEVLDAVTVGFGLRNLVYPEQGLMEIHRVLRPGGVLLILEFSLPVNDWLRRLYHLYSFAVMPRIARLICGTTLPFRYLAESIRMFMSPEEIAGLLEQTGFSDVEFVRFANGLAVACFGRKRTETVHEEEKK